MSTSIDNPMQVVTSTVQNERVSTIQNDVIPVVQPTTTSPVQIAGASAARDGCPYFASRGRASTIQFGGVQGEAKGDLRCEAKRTRAVSESELAAANRRILDVGKQRGEALDYAESRMFYG